MQTLAYWGLKRSRFYRRIAEDSQASYDYVKPGLTPFVILLVSCGIAFVAFVEYLVTDFAFDSTVLRLSCALLVLPLLLPEHRFRLISRKNYWIFAATLCLPFLFGTLLFQNAASGNRIDTTYFYTFEYMVALFLGIQLLFRPLLISFCWFIGTLAVVPQAMFVHNIDWLVFEQTVLIPIPVFLSILVFGAISNRNVAIFEVGRKLAAREMIWNVAHELRTPLASIGMLSRGVEKNLPRLVDGYTKAVEAGLVDQEIRSSRVDTLSQLGRLIEREVMYSNTIIDMLLLNAADGPIHEGDLEVVSITELIELALERFPFNNAKEKRIVRLQGSGLDFYVRAPPILVVHVLFNLIKNAVFYAQFSQQARVEITLHRGEGFNTLFVSDNGPGIDLEKVDEIFEAFYTTRETGQGNGMGLSFCRDVLTKLGGRVGVETAPGLGTKFEVVFPVVGYSG